MNRMQICLMEKEVVDMDAMSEITDPAVGDFVDMGPPQPAPGDTLSAAAPSDRLPDENAEEPEGEQEPPKPAAGDTTSAAAPSDRLPDENTSEPEGDQLSFTYD